MKLALIPPIDLLEWTCETNLQLMLPHLVASERYDYTYRAHCKDPEQYVILDNGAAEQEQVATYRLLEIALMYDVDEVVIPDIIGDRQATLDRKDDFFDIVATEWGPGLASGFRYQYVIQGNSMADFLTSAEDAMYDERVDVIAIPRHALMLQDGLGGQNRKQIADYIAKRSGKPIHLLGGHPNFPCEIRDNGKWPETVRSHDTSSPFNFAYYGFKLRHGNVYKRPGGYFDMESLYFNKDALEYNVRKLREWTGCDK